MLFEHIPYGSLCLFASTSHPNIVACSNYCSNVRMTNAIILRTQQSLRKVMLAAMGWPRSGLPPDRLLRAFGRAVVSVLTTEDRVAAEGAASWLGSLLRGRGRNRSPIGRAIHPARQVSPLYTGTVLLLKIERNRPDTGRGKPTSKIKTTMSLQETLTLPRGRF
jgi:hypothetical protein